MKTIIKIQNSYKKFLGVVIVIFLNAAMTNAQSLSDAIKHQNKAQTAYDQGNYDLALRQINSAIEILENSDRTIPIKMANLKESILLEIDKKKERMRKVEIKKEKQKIREEEAKAELERIEAEKNQFDLINEINNLLNQDSIEIKQLFGSIIAPMPIIEIDTSCLMQLTLKNGETQLYGTTESFLFNKYNISIDELGEMRIYQEYDSNKIPRWCIEINAKLYLDQLVKSSHTRLRRENSREINAWKSDLGEALMSMNKTMLILFTKSKRDAEYLKDLINRLKQKC